MLKMMNLGAPASAAEARGVHDADRRPKDNPPPTRAQSSAAPALTRIIAKPVVWPDLAAKPNRSGLRLRWDALTDDGDLLAAGTEHPLADGAHVLLMRGLSGDALVTMRHHGIPHDSFVPTSLRIPAAVGAKRAENRARLAALRTTHREGTAADGVADPEAPAAARAAPLSKRHAGERGRP
jgi:hypothetical protein